MTSLPSLTWDVSPFLYQSESSAVRYYSVIVCAELLLGYLLLLWQVRRASADDEEAGDFAAYLIPAVIYGARFGHVLFYDFQKFLSDPWWSLKIWTGGMASHGALIGIALASYLFTKRRALPWLESTDRLVFSVALASVLHRFGNLMNSEVPGKPTDGSWGVRFPHFDDYLGQFDAPLRHPTQLYEAALGAVVLGLLWLCDLAWGREQRPRGALTGVLLLALFSGRFVIELWKEPEPNAFALPLLNTAQLLSLPCVAVGAFVLWQSLRRPRAAGWVIGG